MEQRFDLHQILRRVERHEKASELISPDEFKATPLQEYSSLLAYLMVLYPTMGKADSGDYPESEKALASALTLFCEALGEPSKGAEVLCEVGAQFISKAKVTLHEAIHGNPMPGVAELAMRLGRSAYELSALLDPNCIASPQYVLRELDHYMNLAAAFISPRCDTQDVVDSFRATKNRYIDRSVVMLTDTQAYIDAVGEGVLCLDKSPKQILDKYDLAKTIFFYSFDFDYLGEMWIAEIIRRKGAFFPVMMTERRAKYWQLAPTAFRTLREEFFRQSAEGFDKWDEGDFLNIIQAIDLTASLAGDYVEVGAFNGSSAAIALSYLRSIGLKRNTYILDVFDGFNYPEARHSADQFWLGSHATDGRQVVEARLLPRCADPKLLHVVKSNIISDNLPAGIERIAVANLDVDMYEAVIAGLEKLAPLIVPNGILIVEDAGHTPALIGARVALSQFMNTPAGKDFRPVYMESGQTLLIKKS